jgi:shikimate kinase
MKKILLCGYMGSGKTTVGRILSQKTGLDCLDLDSVIAQQAGLPISEIFAQKGEIFFRKKESETFTDLMASPDSFVLALGGGTPAYAQNHLLLKGPNISSFYLKASIETLYERLLHENEARPLVAGKSAEEIKELIAKHLFDRNYYYHQAGYVITVDDKSPETVAEELLSRLT